MSWTCGKCGERHSKLPMVYGAPPPWPAMGVAPEEAATRVDANDDLCVVDGEHFFVRAHLEIPVRGLDEPFAWSVWCSLSLASFDRMMETWENEMRDQDPPFFGWLCTALPTYAPTTAGLKAHVQNRKPGWVPLVVLEPTDHPLSLEQREGIDRTRVEAIAHTLLGHENR